jgi:hypothetical protein
MTMISMVSIGSALKAQAGDHSPRTVALFSCLGLIVSFYLLSFGVDLSTG